MKEQSGESPGRFARLARVRDRVAGWKVVNVVKGWRPPGILRRLKVSALFSSRRRVVVTGAVVVVLAVAVVAVQPFSRSSAAESTAVLETYTLQSTDLQQTMLISGTVNSNTVANVYAPSSLTITDVLVEEGTVVAEGDVLALLDTTSLQYDLRQAELDLASTQAGLTDTAREQSVSVQAAQIELETAQREYDEAKAAAESTSNATVASAKLALAQAQQEYDSLADDVLESTTVKAAKLTLDSAQTKYDELSTAGRSTTEVLEAHSALNDAKRAARQAVSAEDQTSTKAAVRTAQATLKSAQEAADEAIDAAKESLDQAELDYEAAVQSANESFTSVAAALEQAQLDYDSALADLSSDLADAAAALQSAQNGYASASQSSSTTQISIEQQQLTLEQLQQELAAATITAPIAGTVTYLAATIGETAADLMFVIEDTEDLTVVTTVGEADVQSLLAGQPAVVMTDITGDDEFTGEVGYVSSAAVKTDEGETDTSTDVLFSVRVDLTEIDQRIKIGSNATMTVILDEEQGVLAVPIEAVTEMEQGAMVSVVDGEGQIQMVPVELGMETDTMVEVISDQLAEGAQVVADVTSAMASIQADSESSGFSLGNLFGGGGGGGGGGAPAGGGGGAPAGGGGGAPAGGGGGAP